MFLIIKKNYGQKRAGCFNFKRRCHNIFYKKCRKICEDNNQLFYYIVLKKKNTI